MTNEAFARIKIDQLLKDTDWRLTDGISVRYEYPLDDGGRADYALPYRLDDTPLRLMPLFHEEMDTLYGGLRDRAAASPQLQEALTAFENAWGRQSLDWSSLNGKDAIRTVSLLAENMLVSAAAGKENEFTKALNRMKNTNCFPSNDFANIFDRAYTFANTYPNIRHPGNTACMKRDLCPEDAMLAALVFIGLSAYAHDLWKAG